MLFWPLLVYCQQPKQAADILKDKRPQLDLANFLVAKVTTGYNFESELTFPFSKGKFPDWELNSPATAMRFLGGDYSIKVRWFDGDLQQVEKPLGPGRYAFYAEIAGANGIIMRRSATLFCAPNAWDGWSEQIHADLKYFPFDSIPKSIWEENREPISIYARQIILKSILDNKSGSILLSFIHDMRRKNLKPGPLHTPVIMDGDYHVRLKQKILGVESKYKELTLSRKANLYAQSLQSLSQAGKTANAEFEKQMENLCQEWAKASGGLSKCWLPRVDPYYSTVLLERICEGN